MPEQFGKSETIYDLRFTPRGGEAAIYDLRFTIYDLRFTIYDLKQSVHVILRQGITLMFAKDSSPPKNLDPSGFHPFWGLLLTRLSSYLRFTIRNRLLLRLTGLKKQRSRWGGSSPLSRAEARSYKREGRSYKVEGRFCKREGRSYKVEGRFCKKGWLVLYAYMVVLLGLSVLLTACSTDRKAVEPRWLVLVTTQELEDSGLLDVLLPPFEQSSGVRVKRLPLTTAKALEYASLAGVDVLLLPAGAAFDKLAGPAPTLPPFQSQPYPTPTVATGPLPEPSPQPFGYLFNERRLALWSELVVIAPADDPLKLRDLPDLANVFKRIALSNARFYAPGPKSEPGYYAFEQRIWGLIGRDDLKDRGSGYRQVDSDIVSLLKQAADEQAYTFVTAATFVANQEKLKGKLEIGFTGDYALFLPYELATPNNIGSQDRDVKLARTLIAYLTNQKTQATISEYKKPSFSTPLYRPYYFPVYVPSRN